KVHNGSTILSDLKRTDYPETVWGRFNVGPEGTVRWYRRVHDRLRDVGFDAPIMQELDAIARALEAQLNDAQSPERHEPASGTGALDARAPSPGEPRSASL
ncbi:MAG TPA: hypothetical protein VFZ21_21725, partial [Gemmatimonadaceae bacterium]|nr:hypothetical protein [Gemmatimonadaceae bacterium]